MDDNVTDEKDAPSRGFAKLDVGIVDSTMWMKPHDALRVWICLLAKCDSYGIVRAAAPALAHLCFVTLDRFEEIIEELAAPDKHSRTPDNEGRRLQKIEGGWLILNYLRYRDMMQRKAASHAERQAKYRDKVKERDARVTRTVTRDTEADSRGREKRAEEEKTPTPSAPLLDLDLPEEEAAPVKKLTPQQEFIDSAWQTYDDAGAMRPPAALLAMWAKDYFKRNYAWMLRSLADMAPRGALSKGDGYVSVALKNIAEGKSFAPAKPVDERQWVPVGTLDDDL